MIKTTFLILLSIVLLSCNQQEKKNERFEEIEVAQLNQLVAEKTALSAKEIMRFFYPYEIETAEGNEKIELTETTNESGNSVITLIHDNVLDDSVRGIKYVMELKRNLNRWEVVSLKKSWKCWDGRGPVHWGIEQCHLLRL